MGVGVESLLLHMEIKAFGLGYISKRDSTSFGRRSSPGANLAREEIAIPRMIPQMSDQTLGEVIMMHRRNYWA